MRERRTFDYDPLPSGEGGAKRRVRVRCNHVQRAIGKARTLTPSPSPGGRGEQATPQWIPMERTMNQPPYRTLRRAAGAGFTLIEMLAVIVLIGIVASIVVTQVGKRMNSGKYNAGKAALQSLSMKIENYALDNGNPPDNLQALVSAPGGASMWIGPYAKESDLNDPFGNEYGYKAPGDHGTFDLIFYGQDGKPGGSEPLDKDVGNWE